MKRLIAFFMCFMLISALFIPCEEYNAATSKNEPLSPALQIISNREPMAKSVVGESEIRFSERDFLLACGNSDMDYIIITELPSFSMGQLYLGELLVSFGQKIAMSSIDLLSFVPNKNVNEASFTFMAENSEYEKKCNLFFLDSANYSPVSAECDESFFSLQTYKNVKIGGRMVIDDPENDEVRFEIVSYPKNGLLTFLDRNSGDYEYTPVKNFTGDDSFKYAAIDKYGNRSAVITVDIEVKASKYGRIYTDMVNSTAHYGAIYLTDRKIMSAYEDESGSVFMPDLAVSKGEFVFYVMKALKIKPSNNYTDVVMASIPSEYRPYINAANQMGAIYEDISDFDFSASLTRSEACYIIGALLDIGKMKSETVFADGDKIPEYAYDSLQVMAQLNIISVNYGNAEPDKCLDRAECARILSALMLRNN